MCNGAWDSDVILTFGVMLTECQMKTSGWGHHRLEDTHWPPEQLPSDMLRPLRLGRYADGNKLSTKTVTAHGARRVTELTIRAEIQAWPPLIRGEMAGMPCAGSWGEAHHHIRLLDVPNKRALRPLW